MLNEHNGMTLISLTDVNRVVMRDGKIGTEQECLCKCCNCAACECELDVTIGGVTFPADGQRRAVCVDQNGPILNGIETAHMLSVSATLACGDAFELTAPGYRPNQFRVVIRIRYCLVTKGFNGRYPTVGELCDDWINFAFAFLSVEKLRFYQFGDCNDCGCPTGEPPSILDYGDYSYADQPGPGYSGWPGVPANLPCVAEYNEPTQTMPTFSFDCGPCP